MNFFKLYIGDYQRDTAHLSVTEHGAYLLMLQHYYATEKPLPVGRALHRMLRAQDKHERDAIDVVAQRFWRTTDEGLVNDRADVEIVKASAQRETNSAIARTREAKRKTREMEHESCNESCDEASTNRATNDQPNQTPDTRHKPPLPPKGADDEGQTPSVPCPFETIVGLYHNILPELPAVRLMTEKRKRAMRKFWAWVLSSKRLDGTRRAESGDEALEWLRTYFSTARQNDWLMGRTARSAEHQNWECDLDFLLSERGMTKVIEKTRAA